jgi:hypothetical protein
MKNISLILAAMVLGFFVIAGYVLVFTIPAMLIWNWIIPLKFNGPSFNFLEMFGFLLLCKVLFSGVSNSTRNIKRK